MRVDLKRKVAKSPAPDCNKTRGRNRERERKAEDLRHWDGKFICSKSERYGGERQNE